MSKQRIIAFALIAAVVSGVAYWFNQNPPGVTMINPARPPEDILEPAEVEKIRTLQSTKEVYLMGSVSPDDTTILVIAGTGETSAQASWLNLTSGQMEPVDAKVLEYFPQGEIAWSDDRTAVYLSSNANGDPVLVTLPRAAGEFKAETLEISD